MSSEEGRCSGGGKCRVGGRVLVRDVIESLCISVPSVCISDRGGEARVPYLSPSSGGIFTHEEVVYIPVLPLLICTFLTPGKRVHLAIRLAL